MSEHPVDLLIVASAAQQRNRFRVEPRNVVIDSGCIDRGQVAGLTTAVPQMGTQKSTHIYVALQC